MSDQASDDPWRQRLPGRLSLRAQLALVLLVILSAGFGWFVLKYGPHSAYSHYRRAVGWSEKQEYDKAIADYSEAVRLDPKLADAYEGRGNAWLAKNDYDKAIADHNEAVRLDPHSAHAHYNRASAWSERKELLSARTCRARDGAGRCRHTRLGRRSRTRCNGDLRARD
jgi:tetratricopeptide (TPR) repeat protein